MNSALDRRARAEFDKLTRDEVAAAIRRMKVEAYSDDCIARACRLSIEEIRRILSEPE